MSSLALIDDLMNSITTSDQKQNNDASVTDTISKIAVLIAMHDEAKPLISKLKLTESDDYSLQLKPFKVFTDTNNSIFVIVNGKCPKHKCDRVGTQWATLSTYLVITKLSPDIIINMGTCGGVLPKYCFVNNNATDASMDNNTNDICKIADVFICEYAIYSDRRIPLPPWSSWCVGNYPLFGAKYLSQKINSLKIAKCIATSNSFDCTIQDKKIYQKHGVVCKDMECAVIAEMCQEFGVNLIALKGVTDLVEHHDAKHFMENLSKTVAAVTNATMLVIEHIMNKSYSDLK